MRSRHLHIQEPRTPRGGQLGPLLPDSSANPLAVCSHRPPNPEGDNCIDANVVRFLLFCDPESVAFLPGASVSLSVKWGGRTTPPTVARLQWGALGYRLRRECIFSCLYINMARTKLKFNRAYPEK